MTDSVARKCDARLSRAPVRTPTVAVLQVKSGIPIPPGEGGGSRTRCVRITGARAVAGDGRGGGGSAAAFGAAVGGGAEVVAAGGAVAAALASAGAHGARQPDGGEDGGRAKVEAELGSAPLHALFTAQDLLAL